VTAGAFPPAAPLHEQSWHEFSVNWEVDVKVAFHFSKAALTLPLPAGSTVILISSGAALAGSPISGGYAGAKRTQIFIANYAQKESDRLKLAITFTALAPRMMPESELGKHAVAGYARYLGISEADFIQSMDSLPPQPTLRPGPWRSSRTLIDRRVKCSWSPGRASKRCPDRNLAHGSAETLASEVSLRAFKPGV